MYRSPLGSGTSSQGPRPPNTGDKLRSGARVRTGRRGHEASCPSWQPCRRKLRQLHPLVRRRATLDCHYLCLACGGCVSSGGRYPQASHDDRFRSARTASRPSGARIARKRSRVRHCGQRTELKSSATTAAPPARTAKRAAKAPAGCSGPILRKVHHPHIDSGTGSAMAPTTSCQSWPVRLINESGGTSTF